MLLLPCVVIRAGCQRRLGEDRQAEERRHFGDQLEPSIPKQIQVCKGVSNHSEGLLYEGVSVCLGMRPFHF